MQEQLSDIFHDVIDIDGDWSQVDAIKLEEEDSHLIVDDMDSDELAGAVSARSPSGSTEMDGLDAWHRGSDRRTSAEDYHQESVLTTYPDTCLFILKQFLNKLAGEKFILLVPVPVS